MGNLVRVAQIPDDPTCLRLAVRHHAACQLTRLCGRVRAGACVAKQLRGRLQLPRDRREACHQCVVTLARDAVALLEHDPHLPLEQLVALAQQLRRQRKQRQTHKHIRVPRLIEEGPLPDRQHRLRMRPRLARGARLYLKPVSPWRQAPIVGHAPQRFGPVRVVVVQPIAELRLRVTSGGVEEEDDLGVTGIERHVTSMEKIASFAFAAKRPSADVRHGTSWRCRVHRRGSRIGSIDHDGRVVQGRYLASAQRRRKPASQQEQAQQRLGAQSH